MGKTTTKFKTCMVCKKMARWAVQHRDSNDSSLIHFRYACDEHLARACDYFIGLPLAARQVDVCLAEYLILRGDRQYSTMMLFGMPVVLLPGMADMPNGKYPLVFDAS